jgi:hypothetical protein
LGNLGFISMVKNRRFFVKSFGTLTVNVIKKWGNFRDIKHKKTRFFRSVNVQKLFFEFFARNMDRHITEILGLSHDDQNWKSMSKKLYHNLTGLSVNVQKFLEKKCNI